MQASISLVQLLGVRVVRLADILAAVEGDEALARHGATETSTQLIYDNLLPMVQARHRTGPVALKHQDLGAMLQKAWRSFFRDVAGSKTPVTQVQVSLAARIHQLQWCFVCFQDAAKAPAFKEECVDLPIGCAKQALTMRLMFYMLARSCNQLA